MQSDEQPNELSEKKSPSNRQPENSANKSSNPPSDQSPKLSEEDVKFISDDLKKHGHLLRHRD